MEETLKKGFEILQYVGENIMAILELPVAGKKGIYNHLYVKECWMIYILLIYLYI